MVGFCESSINGISWRCFDKILTQGDENIEF
jgi:hypothetical protein